jgi:hypothetical protein
MYICTYVCVHNIAYWVRCQWCRQALLQRNAIWDGALTDCACLPARLPACPPACQLGPTWLMNDCIHALVVYCTYVCVYMCVVTFCPCVCTYAYISHACMVWSWYSTIIVITNADRHGWIIQPQSKSWSSIVCIYIYIYIYIYLCRSTITAWMSLSSYLDEREYIEVVISVTITVTVTVTVMGYLFWQRISLHCCSTAWKSLSSYLAWCEAVVCPQCLNPILFVSQKQSHSAQAVQDAVAPKHGKRVDILSSGIAHFYSKVL